MTDCASYAIHIATGQELTGFLSLDNEVGTAKGA